MPVLLHNRCFNVSVIILTLKSVEKRTRVEFLFLVIKIKRKQRAKFDNASRSLNRVLMFSQSQFTTKVQSLIMQVIQLFSIHQYLLGNI